MFGFSEQNQDGYLDSADESVHTVPRACNSSRVEANQLDPSGESAVNPSLGDDEVGDDSDIVASNTGREIVLICLHIPSTKIIALCHKASQGYGAVYIQIVFLNKCIHCLLIYNNNELGIHPW